MKKRFKKVLALVATLIVSAFTFTGCFANGGGHEHEFKTKYVSPTCIEKGYIELTCDCGEKYKSDYVDALGHSFKTYYYNGDATCESDGTETARCTRFGCAIKDIRSKRGTALGHKFVFYDSDENATCEDDGTETATCNRKGCSKTDTRTLYYSALGHDFTSYVSDENATCEDDGTETATCNREGCSKTDTHTLYYSAHGHEYGTYISDKNATYEQDGTKTAKCIHYCCTATQTITDEGSRLKHNYNVTLVYNNSTANVKKVVVEGETLSQPADPKKENYIFTGWYTSQSLSKRFDFSTPITTNIFLYAGYELDAINLTNKITTQVMKSVVTIYNKSYNENWFGSETDSKTSFGSGFCFHIQGGVYYFLTNCHVALKESGFDKQTLTIEDYKGNLFSATIYSNSSKLGSAISPDYDLAVLRAVPTSTEIQSLTITTTDPMVNSDVISLGSPKHQHNAITYGTIYRYGTVSLTGTPTTESNVTFSVAQHTALTDNGSSGGPLINSNLQVVGVNYAGSIIEGFGDGCAIPAKKVWEFLRNYVYS